MTKTILLPLPTTVDATYVVAAPERPLSAAELTQLGDTMPDGVDLRIQEIGGADPFLTRAIQVLSCPDCSPEVDPLIAVLVEATQGHLAITCTAVPGWPPAHLEWCAAVTDRVAELTGGIRLDAEAPRLLPDPWRPQPLIAPEHFAVADWTWVGYGVEANGRYGMWTTGLARLGLPELSSTRLAADHVHGWFHFFNGLAQVLASSLFHEAAKWSGRGGVEIEVPLEVVVSTADVAAAQRVPPPTMPLKARARLRLDGRTRRLAVLAPPESAGDERRWRDLVADSMCGRRNGGERE